MRNRLLATAVATFVATTACAQTIPAPAIDYSDVDNDGAVSAEEFEAQMDELFRLLDVDGNNRISWAEAQVTVTRELFDGADGNRSGYIDRTEFVLQVRRDFDVADQDDDGVLE